MALGVEWSSTERARGSTRFDEPGDRDREGARPFLREGEFESVLFLTGLDGDFNGLSVYVDRDGDVARYEVRLVLGLETDLLGQMTGAAEVNGHLTQPFGQSAQLKFFALYDHETASLAHLEQEKTITDLSANPHHHLVGRVKDVVHDGANSLSDEVEFTQSTRGAPVPIASALTEQVEMTVRWKRSSGTPWA